MNNNSLVIEVYEESNQWWCQEVQNPHLYCRVGHARFEDNRIAWGNSNVIGSDEQQHYSKGCRPRVALNNSNIVVVVHESIDSNYNRKRCYYRVGVVNNRQCNVEWGSESKLDCGIGDEFEFGQGSFPGVAINDNNTVILTYSEDKNRETTRYRLGFIDTLSMEIVLPDENQALVIPGVSAKKLTLAVNKNRVVAAYQDPEDLCCIAGIIKDDNIIRWDFQHPLILATARNTYKPDYPVISIDSQGYFVIVHSSFKNATICKMICNIGHFHYNGSVIELEIFSQSDHEKEYGNGRHPAVAIDDDKRIVEIHETNAEQDQELIKLYYQFGEISSQVQDT